MLSPKKPTPPPKEANNTALIAGGTIAWAVALIVSLVLGAEKAATVSGCGFALGLYGLRYVRKRKPRSGSDQPSS